MTKNNTDIQESAAGLKSFMLLKKKWKDFYRNLGLDSLVETLDFGDVPIDVTELRKDSEAILLFPVGVQKRCLAYLKDACERSINGCDPGEIWLSPDTVGPNFPNNISFEDRPEIPYVLCLENSQEPPKETTETPHDNVKSGGELRKILKEKKRTGLTLFEYFVFRRNLISQCIVKKNKNHFPDTMHSTWLLNSSLPDERILVAGAHTDGMLKIWAWPKSYKEHNCQGARWGVVVPLV